MTVQSDPTSARAAANRAAEDVLGTGERHMSLSSRQKYLSELWSYFRAAEHEDKRTDWDGRPATTSYLRGAIRRETFAAPGYEQISENVSFFDRRPVAPLSIVRQIVSRFTGLLFSDRRQPRMTVPGDNQTEDALNAQLRHGNFWPAMYQARNYGGSMGSSCVGFRFLQGNVQFEAFDPRWAHPEFLGRGVNDLVKLTIQYTYSKEEQQDGEYKTVWYWFRRVIDTETDTTWVPIKCRDKEPNWDYMKHNVVRHGLGFVPYEWIQNLRSDDEIDGDPDCMGCYSMVKAVDHLISEVFAGTINNCDPTLTLTTNENLASIQKGSDNAIKLPQGSSAQYLELQGAGPRIGMEVAKELRDEVYRLAQCVPDWVLQQNQGEKTATEIERIFSSMFEKADALRGQYGPPMIRLCQKLLQAIRQYTSIREVPQEDGTVRLIRGRIYMPPKVVQQPDGDIVEVPRALGKGTLCDIRWPSYQRPSYTDQDTYSRVITTLLGNEPKVLTRTTAMQLLAPVMDFDPLKELHSIKREEEDEEAKNAAAEAPPEEGMGGEAGGAAPSAPETANNPAMWSTALNSGIITLNEYREKALGLGAIPDGDLTIPQYRAKYASVFVSSTAATSDKSVDIVTGKGVMEERRADEMLAMKREEHQEKKKATRAKKATAKPEPGIPTGAEATSPSAAQQALPQERPNSAPEEPSSEPAAPEVELTEE